MKSPKKDLIKAELLKNKEAFEAGLASYNSIARTLGVTPPYVRLVALEMGFVSRHTREPWPEGRAKPQPVTEDKLRNILLYLEENGGYINNAVKALGYPYETYRIKAHKYAKEIGFDVKKYRYAHKEYGLWKVLPGVPEPCYVCDFRVPALCRGCGQTYSVTISNLKGGQTLGCSNCCRRGIAKSLTCLESKETFKTIRSLARELGVPYQTLRYQLARKGEFKHEDKTYVFTKE